MSDLGTCPLCHKQCSARYREVPRGQRALFVCSACVEALGLPPGGYARPGAVAVVDALLKHPGGRPN